MRVLHVVPSYWPAFRYGGPIRTVHGLCTALGDAGVDVDVATTDANGSENLDVPLDSWTTVGSVRVRYFHRIGRLDYAMSPGLLAFLATSVPKYDLVHITSTFSFPATAAGWASRRNRVPYVVSPRGSLEPWSRRQKRWKKVPYWHLVERRHLVLASRIHATAESEAHAVCRVVPRASVCVIPNGVEECPVVDVRRDARRIIFLGRVHKKKGFDVLVPALSEVARTHADVELVIAGPDDDGYRATVEGMIMAAKPMPKVRWVGQVVGDEKWRLLASARAFVLSSHSENFGQAVVEALAARTPVVVSKNCPWASVETERAGYWIQNTPQAFAEAIRRILNAAPEEYRSLQESAKRLASTFAWAEIGRAMARQYEAIARTRG